MYPILFQSSGFTFYTQTLFFIIAFVAGLWVAVHEGKRFSLSRLDITDVVLWSFLSAFLGARLLFMILHQELSDMTLREFCILGTLDGGFAFHGGLLAGGLTGFAVTWIRRLPVWRLADALAPGLAVAIFFMRLGCVCNGCCYGIKTTLPWGIFLHGAYRHPTQLYEGVGNLALVPFLMLLNKKPGKPGQTFLWYSMLSAFLRFGVDFYRDEYKNIWGILTIPQLLACVIAILAGLGLLFRLPQKILGE